VHIVDSEVIGPSVSVLVLQELLFSCAAWVVLVADLKPKLSSGAVQKSNREKLDSSQDVQSAMDALAAENRSLLQEEKVSHSKNSKQEQEVTVSSLIP